MEELEKVKVEEQECEESQHQILGPLEVSLIDVWEIQEFDMHILTVYVAREVQAEVEVGGVLVMIQVQNQSLEPSSFGLLQGLKVVVSLWLFALV